MDICKCITDKCPVRESCHRWQKDWTKNYLKDQYCSYFSEPPFKIKDGKFECDMYWGDKTKLIYEHLKEVINAQRIQDNET